MLLPLLQLDKSLGEFVLTRRVEIGRSGCLLAGSIHQPQLRQSHDVKTSWTFKLSRNIVLDVHSVLLEVGLVKDGTAEENLLCLLKKKRFISILASDRSSNCDSLYGSQSVFCPNMNSSFVQLLRKPLRIFFQSSHSC